MIAREGKVKLVVNAILGVGMQAFAEAVTFGEKIGLERGHLLDVLEETAVLSPSQRAKLANVRDEEYPTQFALSLMHKDFGLVLDEAATVSAPMPATAVAQQTLAAAMALRMDGDCSMIVKFVETLGGMR